MTSHGWSDTKTYQAWTNMRARCKGYTHAQKKNYPERGISIDPRWEVFAYFVEDMGERPEGLSLERIDNDKGYSKANCKWATREEQNANQRVREDTSTGVAGVNIEGLYFRVYAQRSGVRKCLYTGYDFFEACCTRKSWEAKGRPVP